MNRNVTDTAGDQPFLQSDDGPNTERSATDRKNSIFALNLG